MKYQLAVAALLLMLFILLTGCATIKPAAGHVLPKAQAAADDALAAAEWYLCKGASVGAIVRRYGDKALAYRALCFRGQDIDLLIQRMNK